MAHTPGQWEPCDGASVGNLEWPTHVKRTFLDEQGRRVTQFVATCNDMLPEVHANARLIAAAPEMLAALKLAVGEGSSFACPEETEAKLLAAIAKAEGH